MRVQGLARRPMDRNRDGGEGLMVRERRALTLLVERKVLALTLKPRTPIATLFSSLRGGAAACRAARAPSQGNQTKARWLWEAPLTAQRASAEAPFPQPNDAVCPVPVHGPRTHVQLQVRALIEFRPSRRNGQCGGVSRTSETQLSVPSKVSRQANALPRRD